MCVVSTRVGNRTNDQFAGDAGGTRVFYEDGLNEEYKLQMYTDSGSGDSSITTVATSDSFFAGPQVDLQDGVVYYIKETSGTYALERYHWSTGTTDTIYQGTQVRCPAGESRLGCADQVILVLCRPRSQGPFFGLLCSSSPGSPARAPRFGRRHTRITLKRRRCSLWWWGHGSRGMQ